MFAWDGGWQRIWGAAVLVRAQSQVCKVKGGRRPPANSLLLISEWRRPLSTATSLFIKIPDTHVSVSAHVYLCRRSHGSKSYIYILCALCLHGFVKLIQESRPGQKQWGLTAKMPLKVHMKIPPKLKMTEKKIPLIMKRGWFCISSCSHFQLRNIHAWMWWQCPWWAA